LPQVNRRHLFLDGGRWPQRLVIDDQHAVSRNNQAIDLARHDMASDEPDERHLGL